MAFDQGGSVQPGIVDTFKFTLSPDYAFPPNRSLSGSFATDSPRTSSSGSLTPSDEIEFQEYCRAYSIGFYFPPADSEASSESASSSPAVWDESQELDSIDEDSAVVGEDNRMPFFRFRRMRKGRKQGVQNTMMSSLGGRAPSKSLEKMAEVLDTIGSSLTDLHLENGSFTRLLKRNKASILAFEAASTIIKAATLLKSLSKENLKFFEMEIFCSVGVRTLISGFREDLLTIYASDKREELNRLLAKVVMLGNLCIDPQWHLSDIYFSRLESSNSKSNLPRTEGELIKHQLVICAEFTLGLYHSFNAMGKLENDYIQKLHEVGIAPSRRGELKLLQSELKAQRRRVRRLKKKSLWSRNLEEIMEFLVDAVTCAHQLIMEVFGNKASRETCENLNRGPESLGKDGLAFHYSNIVLQIDNIASDTSAVSSKARDSLYDALPAIVKKNLRSRLRSLGAEEEHLSASEIKAEMDKTLEWLVPLATNTSIALQRFGLFREWNEFDEGITPNYNSLSRFQTLFHAKKHKIDDCIIELVTWLHRLVISSRNQDDTRKIWPWKSQNHSISKTQVSLSPNHDFKPGNTDLSTQNRLLTEQQAIVRSKSSPAASKSLRSVSLNMKKLKKLWGSSRSLANPAGLFLTERVAPEHQTPSILDAMDGLDFAKQ